MDNYNEIKELENTIKEIRENYTDLNKSWRHQLRPSIKKGGLNFYLAEKLYKKGYRNINEVKNYETTKSNLQFLKKIAKTY